VAARNEHSCVHSQLEPAEGLPAEQIGERLHAHPALHELLEALEGGVVAYGGTHLGKRSDVLGRRGAAGVSQTTHGRGQSAGELGKRHHSHRGGYANRAMTAAAPSARFA
jgi:hypothetical protein